MVFATVGSVASVIATAHAEPRPSSSWAASGFAGIDWFGERTELGNSWAPEQVPGTAPLVGGRVSWLAVPRLATDLQLAIEGELAIAPAFTGETMSTTGNGGRRSYFAPVFAWRAHALLRLSRWRAFEPHLVLGGGGETVASTSPFMSKETDPIAYWGPGVSVPVLPDWHLRVDLRHGLMPARDGGVQSTVEVAFGLQTTFGLPATARPRRAAAPPPEPPAAIDPPEPDPDGDGILGDADQCPDQAEDFDGWEDADGCPEPDNDHDGIADPRDTCPGEPETRNGFEDDDGCPDQLPAALGTTIKFEPGRARVTAAAGAALRPVLAMLQNHPALRLVIVGHHDLPENADLAKRRADAVKWHLVDQGIAEDRITAGTGLDAKAPPVTFQLAPAPP